MNNTYLDYERNIMQMVDLGKKSYPKPLLFNG